MSPEQLGALYALCQAAEDAGLDESTIAQDLRVALIDAGLAGAVQVVGEPDPQRVELLIAASEAGAFDCAR
jgi:hypothetical protein